MDEQKTPAAEADDNLSGDAAQVEDVAQEHPEPEDSAAEPQAVEQPAPAADQPPVIVKKGGAMSFLALLLAAGAAGLSGYMWTLRDAATVSQQPLEMPDLPDYSAAIDAQASALQTQGQQLESRLNAAVSELRTTVGDARTALETDLNEVKRQNERLRAEREGLDSGLADVEQNTRRAVSGFERRLGHLETSISALADRRTDTTSELALAEAEYLLRAASERLSLFDDPQGAGRALALAAEQLQAVNDPIYNTVRQSLANHRQALNQLQLPDRVALSTELLALARSSVDWPLDARRSLNTSGANLLVPEATEEGWWPRFKSVLSNVVVVHREKETATVLLTLEEERLLRENIRLQLQVAQLAAARGEQALFESSISAVRDWMNEYYEVSAEPVAQALSSLDSLASTELSPALPDISQALRQLRNIRSTENLAGQMPTAADEATP